MGDSKLASFLAKVAQSTKVAADVKQVQYKPVCTKLVLGALLLLGARSQCLELPESSFPVLPYMLPYSSAET